MNQKTNNKDEQALSLQLLVCLEKIQFLQSLTLRKQWDKLEEQVNLYQDEIAQLKHITQSFAVLPQTFKDDFVHLSCQQRRVMRAIHDHMQLTAEDIDSVNRGISRLKRIAELNQTPK
ncbi:MAG: hypothetical protein R8M46_08740 [Ghiorsea sp.]